MHVTHIFLNQFKLFRNQSLIELSKVTDFKDTIDKSVYLGGGGEEMFKTFSNFSRTKSAIFNCI